VSLILPDLFGPELIGRLMKIVCELADDPQIGFCSRAKRLTAIGWNSVFPTVLWLAFAEIIENRSVIQNASVCELDPLFDIRIVRRLPDAWHFPNDGDERTGITRTEGSICDHC
jgi:hypothetical protein